MAKMRVYDIARSFNVKSSELVKILNENGFEVKSHNSSIEDAAIAFVLKNVKPNMENPADSEKASDKKKDSKTASDKAASEKEKKPVEEKKEDSTEKVEKVEKLEKPEKAETVEKPEPVKTEENKSTSKKENSTNMDVTEKKEKETVQETNKEKAEQNSNRDNNGENRSFNKENRENNGGNRSFNRDNNNGGNRTFNRDNNNGGNRSFNRDNNNGGNRPYNRDNNNGGNRSFNRDNNNGGNRPYNRDNNNGGNRSFNRDNNNGGNRSFNRDNNNGGNRSFNRDNNNGGNRTFNRDNNGDNRSFNRDNGQRNSFSKQRSDFDKSIFDGGKPLEKTPQRKNDKSRKNTGDRNKSSKYRENDISELMPKKDPNRKGAFIKPQPVQTQPEEEIKTIIIPEVLTIRDLADKMKQPAAAIVKKLFLQGKMYSINQEITFEEAEEIALEYDIIAEKEEQVDVIEEILKEDEEDEALMEKRPPVVCVMGHVDHGKTSLLDAIRETRVTEREAGGITQHIGAYMVEAAGEQITFLDTPGHEAFTSMRMRGAKSTDIAILVVAADDGVMPQTVEAINHAKAAEVEIIVAINKIDKPGANIERVKQELAEYELIAEDWGGSTVFVPVSAKTKEGIDNLLEMILLTSEMLELKANKNRLARGIVIEAQLDKGRGPVATILVQKGTLHVGDPIVIGSAYGKVRAMMDDQGRRVKEATPSTPVEILGLNEVPDAGEVFMATENDKEARSIAEAYIKQGREKLLADTKAKLSLDGLFSQIQAGNIKELNLIVKADVQGSVEAVKQSLLKLSNEEVAIRVIHAAVGAVNESDVTLASASNAIIIAFNVRPDPTAKETAEREKVDLRLYKVIYNAIEDIEAAMKGMLDPVYEEKVIGHAEIRQVFKASKVGNIAGSYVLDGKIVKDSKVRITRDDELIYEGNLASLKRFKDDVKEVNAGYECGLVFDKFDSFKEEDKVEIYVMEEVPR